MKTALFSFLGFVVWSTLAHGACPSFKKCQITNGQVFSCGAWYQGSSAVLKDGTYHICKIVNGQIFSCEGVWYQGSVPALDKGAYHSCKIVNGKIFSCEGKWYQGEAVVLTDK